MPGAPIPAYPKAYTTSTLDFRLTVLFEQADGHMVQVTEGQPLTAGTQGTWHFHIRNQAHDLPAGSVLTLVRWNVQIAFMLQDDRPLGRDYCTLESNSSAQLALLPGRSAVNLLSIVVQSGVFKQGDELSLRIGDRRWGSVGSEIFWSATEGAFLLAVDSGGQGTFQGIAANPIDVRVVAHPQPHTIRLLGPTVVQPDEPFNLHLGVFDRNQNLLESYTGIVELDVPDAIDNLPSVVHFSPKTTGLIILPDVRIRQDGVYRIGVSEAAAGLSTSNPIVVQEDPQTRIYWGDVHAHGWGDSTMYLMFLRSTKLDPLQRHLQARDIGRLDFACPAAMSMDPEQREEVWQIYREACRQVDEPDRYVPFLAYEAHPKAGDRQVIFKEYANEPVPPSMRAPMADVEAQYGGRDDVLLQVHIGGDPPHWDRYRPQRERFLEIVSGFGCAEWLLQKALQLGYEPAVCGASDLHLGLMGGPRAVETFRGRFGQKYPMRQRDSAYGTGPLTAIAAPRLQRQDLWSAVMAKQTYATSGARIYLQVKCNGTPAGGELALNDAVTIEITCHGCAQLRQIDLIVGMYRAHSWYPGTLDFSGEITLADAELPGSWLYVRVEQADGEYAWSSPVWLRRQRPVPVANGLPRWNEESAPVPAATDSGDASPHLPDLLRYLEIEEDISWFHDVTPVGIFSLSMGRCALFYCTWSPQQLPMTIRWFYEFDIPKIRYDLGWRDYGIFDELKLGPELMALRQSQQKGSL